MIKPVISSLLQAGDILDTSTSIHSHSLTIENELSNTYIYKLCKEHK